MNDNREWDGKDLVSVIGYEGVLQEFDSKFYLQVFSGVLLQSRTHFKSMQTKVLVLVAVSQKCKNFRFFLTEMYKSFDQFCSN
jgi:hypothetical protein